MVSRKLRVFLDTSALIAGILSSKGAAREVLRLGEAEVIEIVVSRQVLIEADRVLQEKFQDLLDSYHAFLKSLDPVVVDDPPHDMIQKVLGWIDSADAPILAAAIQAKVDYLISWNTRHFMKKSVVENTPFPVLVPAGFLEEFRKLVST